MVGKESAIVLSDRDKAERGWGWLVGLFVAWHGSLRETAKIGLGWTQIIWTYYRTKLPQLRTYYYYYTTTQRVVKKKSLLKPS